MPLRTSWQCLKGTGSTGHRRARRRCACESRSRRLPGLRASPRSCRAMSVAQWRCSRPAATSTSTASSRTCRLCCPPWRSSSPLTPSQRWAAWPGSSTSREHARLSLMHRRPWQPWRRRIRRCASARQCRRRRRLLHCRWQRRRMGASILRSPTSRRTPLGCRVPWRPSRWWRLRRGRASSSEACRTILWRTCCRTSFAAKPAGRRARSRCPPTFAMPGRPRRCPKRARRTSSCPGAPRHMRPRPWQTERSHRRCRAWPPPWCGARWSNSRIHWYGKGASQC
mmetsp:Transcript_130131/g.376482  ORF Transcript_130131/g.376482 Transcript_130131/m.376482 type:complete len:282 (-) Transcript_130131:148-993(-)